MADPPTDTAGVTHPSGQSKYYIVIISSSIHGHVQAWLPDSIQISIRSNWGSIVSTELGAAFNWFTSAVLGHTLVSKKQTAQEWRGSEPLELVLPLHFFATQDSKIEVIEPIKRLMKMTLPRRNNSNSDSFLIAPGPVPSLFGKGETTTGPAEGAQDLINVYIGNYFRLTNVFISLMQNVEFKAKLDKNGFPMEAVTTIQFRTLYSPLAENMDEYLGTYTGTDPAFNRPNTIGF
jgi:hypothetical protein